MFFHVLDMVTVVMMNQAHTLQDSSAQGHFQLIPDEEIQCLSQT